MLLYYNNDINYEIISKEIKKEINYNEKILEQLIMKEYLRCSNILNDIFDFINCFTFF
jgi:hypothetical protein